MTEIVVRDYPNTISNIIACIVQCITTHMDHKTRIRTSPKYFHSRRNILYLRDGRDEFVRICTRDVNEQAAEANKLVATSTSSDCPSLSSTAFCFLPLRPRTFVSLSAGAIFSPPFRSSSAVESTNSTWRPLVYFRLVCSIFRPLTTSVFCGPYL
jgi:hypothetical protein